MNLNDSEFEEQLRALRPAAPAPELAAALARALKSPGGQIATAGVLARPARRLPGILRGLGWACAGAAGAVAVLVLWERSQPPAAAVAHVTAPAFDHAESSAELVAAEDEGFVYADDEPPARQFRYNSIERHVWTNASTGARMEIEIPREDLRLLPVALQ